MVVSPSMQYSSNLLTINSKPRLYTRAGKGAHTSIVLRTAEEKTVCKARPARLNRVLLWHNARIAASEERGERAHDLHVHVEVHAAVLVESEVADRVRRLELHTHRLEHTEPGGAILVVGNILGNRSVCPEVIVVALVR